ncbi:MAG TPA: LamG-like jellyroll fold domain-containing protein [Planctomycetota bacterium]|jgi:hypothetical protein
MQNTRWLFLATVLCCAGAHAMVTPPEIRVVSFALEKPVARAKRATGISAAIENACESAMQLRATLVLPATVRLTSPKAEIDMKLEPHDEAKLSWTIESDAPGECDLKLEVTSAENTARAAATVRVLFLPALEPQKLDYIPEPDPLKTSMLIGAHNCPLWESDKPEMWANLKKHPERTPALGFYSQENPEVADWETKWAVEHGVSFFVYCWYRDGQGGPVKQRFGSAIHDALFKSKFASKMKFTIMWENQTRGKAGVANEDDLLNNLLPFWIDNYFKNPSYLKIDNKPVLFIYVPTFLIQDLGGEANVAKAFDKMREACRKAGFDGLYILGEYRGQDAKVLQQFKRLGVDYSFAYCWHIQNNPTPQQAIDTQMRYIRKTQDLNVLPQVVTVSQAWSGWRDEGSIWKIPPTDFETLLRQAKDFTATLPKEQLGSRMLLLDNWNEWGEGHYILPYREYGFGYLDAVRKVFGENPKEPHVDLLPEDIGRGPYDTAIRTLLEKADENRKLVRKRVTKGKPDPDLIAWWAFDENKDAPFALDYSGNRLGGKLEGAQRAAGIDGNALVCNGGCVIVENSSALSPTTALSIACWVKTDTAAQSNNWFLNRVFAGGTSSGYRMGVVEGKPCFEIPLTDWSHHLKANEPLPTGRWVHLAGTFDGKTMRIYVDGKEQGSLERPGEIKPNAFHLCIGNFEVKHAAFFNGLLDEVKLYRRALTADEIRKEYEDGAERAVK